MFVFIIPQTRQNCMSPSALKTYTYAGNIYKQKRCHPLRQHRLACKHYFSIIIIAHRKTTVKKTGRQQLGHYCVTHKIFR